MAIVLENIDEFNLTGLSIEIGRSQKNNAELIRKHWQYFNRQLHVESIKLGNDWHKFAVTLRQEQHLYYFIGVLQNQAGRVIPNFERLQILPSQYAKIENIGSMNNLTSTINHLYDQVNASTELTINDTGLLVHFEHYDKRFSFSRPNSIIEIYLPVL